MQRLTKCKACGADIAKSAKACPRCGARQKKNIPLGIFLLIVGLILFFNGLSGFISTNKGKESNPPVAATSSIDETASPDEAEEVNPSTISLEEFNAISTGMTYEEVVGIIGSEGEVLSEVDIGMGEEYKTTMYTWKGEGSLGANANVTIQGGKVTAKAQLGLK